LVKAALHVLGTCTMNTEIPESLIKKFIKGGYVPEELLA
jgi:hypothetical protein